MTEPSPAAGWPQVGPPADQPPAPPAAPPVAPPAWSPPSYPASSYPATSYPATSYPATSYPPSGYPPSSYPPPGWYAPPVPPRPHNGFGVASVVLGAVGLVSGWFLLGLVPAVVGVVLGLVGRARVARGTATNPRVATVGVVLSVLAIPVGIALYLAVRHYVSHHCYLYDDGDRRTHTRCD